MSGILQGLLASIGGVSGGGLLYSWGRNYHGQIGDNSRVNRSSPVQVGALTTWLEISGGGSEHAASIKNDGTLWTWGRNNAGQLGQDNLTYRSSPIQIGALTNWSKLDCGSGFVSSIKNDGSIWTWGTNTNGNLGDDTTINKSSPIQVGNLINWSKVSCGGNHMAAIKTDGTIWLWGRNTYGQIGDNSAISRSSPVQIGALTTWSEVSCGSSFTSAIKTDGTIWSWGRNTYGNLGDNTSYNVSKSSPVQIGALTNWSQVSSGTSHVASIKTDGTLWTWGRNFYGALGTNTQYDINRSSPVQVGALTTWSQVSSGSTQTASIKTDGTLWTWGRNNYGQNGDNTVINRSSPVQIGSNAWNKISCGNNFVLAIED